MQKWIILGVVLFITIICVVIVLNVDIETEYIPESEIEEIELRKTIVSLYFKDKTTGNLSKETRLIDSKELLKNPYEKLINLLFEGPQNGNLEKILPDNVNIIDLKYEKGLVTIDFSKEFLDSSNPEIIAKSIEETLKELAEVSSIKILVEGNELESFRDTITTEDTNVT